jgi:mono/diheme cytochrome c family protein
MKRAVVILFLVVVVIGIGAVVFLKVAARGFSAREEPTGIEKVVARTARRAAISGSVKSMQNPQPNTPEVLANARAHWADHCVICHANNGSGDTEIGRSLYPRSPDMRQSDTQNLTDGELFFIIENGIRLTGMPAWGGSQKSAEDSWKLVRFIRHLPQVSEEEEREMRRLNPKTPAELQEEKEEEDFLKGDDSHAKPREHSKH